MLQKHCFVLISKIIKTLLIHLQCPFEVFSEQIVRQRVPKIYAIFVCNYMSFDHYFLRKVLYTKKLKAKLTLYLLENSSLHFQRNCIEKVGEDIFTHNS